MFTIEWYNGARNKTSDQNKRVYRQYIIKWYRNVNIKKQEFTTRTYNAFSPSSVSFYVVKLDSSANNYTFQLAISVLNIHNH